MKVSVVPIVRGHWRTLYDANSGKISYGDIALFYGTPTTFGLLAYLLNVAFKTEVYNISITFFGIFIALLLNIQVAIFGIFLRKWDVPEDKRQAELQGKHLIVRRRLLSELNTNISYLTVVSAASLVAFVFFFINELQCGIAPSIACSLYTHFILTFMMVLRRSYSLFQREYEDSNC